MTLPHPFRSFSNYPSLPLNPFPSLPLLFLPSHSIPPPSHPLLFPTQLPSHCLQPPSARQSPLHHPQVPVPSLYFSPFPLTISLLPPPSFYLLLPLACFPFYFPPLFSHLMLSCLRWNMKVLSFNL